MKSLLIAASFSFILLSNFTTEAASAKSVLREEARVVIDGIEESWRLEWKSNPIPVCSPDEEDWDICPCKGFAYGERGDLVLVRKRPGYEDENVSLTHVF